MDEQLPKLARIMRQVAKQLSAIRRENDYYTDATVYELQLGREIKRGPGTIIPMLGPATRLDDEALGESEWDQKIYLMCYAGQPEDVSQPVDYYIARLQADIEVAMEGNNDRVQLGGLAIESFITDFTPFDDDKTKLSGTNCTLSIHYRTVQGSPTD